eukprot:3643584-Rhodomonas_salina.1
MDGPTQTQGLDCFGFAALALCCRLHDRPIRFTAGEALQCREWVASILVETGAPGVLTPVVDRPLVLPPVVASTPVQSTPPVGGCPLRSEHTGASRPQEAQTEALAL